MKELEAIQFVHDQLLTKPKLPAFKTGDTIIVTYNIVEGDKTRERDYRAEDAGCPTEDQHGVGVERIFSFSNPNIAAIEVVKRGKVRRARLFYLRGLVGKKARIKELKYTGTPAKN